MKVCEIIESREETSAKIALMLRRKKKRNPNPDKPSKHDKYNTRGAEDSFTGYSLGTFAQTTWR